MESSSTNSAARMRRWRIALIAAGAATVLAGGALAWWRAAQWPKRFVPVVEGRLYRSGKLTPQQLEHVAREYGIRTVLSLLDPDAPESRAERAAAAELGIRWLNVRLPGDGQSAPEERERIRAIVLDPNHGPLLVHCAAGVNRTGLAVGCYRIHAQGWTYEQVLREMRSLDFEDKAHHEELRAALREEERLARLKPAQNSQ
jgi:protein tyrosine/serine phosphatase